MSASLLEPVTAVRPGTRHLLSSEDLDRAAVERLLELAASFEAVAEREVKKLPTLRGRTVLSVFFEASTRTSSSFELAAKRLSADTISLKAGGSSVEKGETLKDTLLTLDAYGPDVVVIRHAQVGAAALATRYTRAAVVNAGDGAHQHPTQSLLDLYAMRAALGRVEGVHVAIVGDVLHSRVARSNLALLLRLRRARHAVGPPSLIPRGIEATGVSVSHDIGDDRAGRRRLRPAHAARAHAARRGLRAEPARVHAALRHHRRRGCGPGQIVMHPGPMNRGVEISDEVADSAASLVTRQVRAGLVVRMAVLYDLLGRRGGGGVSGRDAGGWSRRRARAPTCSCAAPACSIPARASTRALDVLVRDGAIAELGDALRRTGRRRR